MLQILIFGDSLSWGIIPGSRSRLAFDQRWPGVLEQELLGRDVRARIVKDCLNGRRTAFPVPKAIGGNADSIVIGRGTRAAGVDRSAMGGADNDIDIPGASHS